MLSIVPQYLAKSDQPAADPTQGSRVQLFLSHIRSEICQRLNIFTGHSALPDIHQAEFKTTHRNVLVAESSSCLSWDLYEEKYVSAPLFLLSIVYIIS